MIADSRAARAVALLLGIAVAGCQVYLAGGPPSAAPAARAPARAAGAGTTSDTTATWPDTAPDDDTDTADPAAPYASAATFPGERYFRAGGPRTLVLAAEDVLTARDYRVLRSGVAPRGGEVHGEHRQHTDTQPRTTTSPAWRVRAGVVRIAGSDWDDCCYVTATFTTTRLNSRGDVLATSAADEPENEILRTWFFDDLARYLRSVPAD